jgi:hypothetical protein
MIRRRVGNEFWLIAQHDHALLSGELAKHFGNARFAKPEPDDQTTLAIHLHDCGWPMHDECPTLNKDRLPLDVFESSPQLGFSVWSESSRRAVERGPYCGLLVSLHGLNLSALATAQTFDNEQFDINDARVRFEVNKFQHAQIELQERLRKQLGMHIDIPLHCGIAPESNDRQEQHLAYNFRMLQALDKLSLCICCTKPPFANIEPLTHRPGGPATSLDVTRPTSEKLLVHPWPFDVDLIPVSVPYRRVQAMPFADEREFREAYKAASIEQLACVVAPH